MKYPVKQARMKKITLERILACTIGGNVFPHVTPGACTAALGFAGTAETSLTLAFVRYLYRHRGQFIK